MALPSDLWPMALALVLALVLTPAVRVLARRLGLVAQPKRDRWHQQPTPLLGGLALLVAVALPCLLLLPLGPQDLVILGASAFLWLVGLIDDRLQIKPYKKLAGQVMAAALVLSSGLALPWTPWPLANMAVTFFWLVGITNAVNLLDNMDGLAAGVALIASVFLALHFALADQLTELLMAAVLAAALLGFLVYNTHPASIFMGDCGSLFLGFFLAAIALHAAGGRSRSLLPVLAVPVLVLVIPIFDTTLVTVMRQLSGRGIAQGGRDHTSHRLVALGLSERRAVWLLYALAALSGLLGLLVSHLPLAASLALVLGFTVGLTLLGVWLAQVQVYEPGAVQAAHHRPMVSFLIDVSYKRRVFEVLLDGVLIVLSYYVAYAVCFGPAIEEGPWEQFLRVLPVLVVVKITAFLALGVYRGLWRYMSVDDLVLYGKAVLVGSVASVLVLLFWLRFDGFSRAVLLLDGLILLLLLAGSRLTFRLFRSLLPLGSAAGRRVLIYGAGDGGELLVRELRNNGALGYRAVGFVDDDPLKTGRVIHGIRVLGGNGALVAICRRYAVEEVLISSTKFSPERLAEIVRVCDEARVAVKRMCLRLEQLGEQVIEPGSADPGRVP